MLCVNPLKERQFSDSDDQLVKLLSTPAQDYISFILFAFGVFVMISLTFPS